MADPIKYESQLGGLLKDIIGTTVKTGGSTSTQTSTANTNPLQQIFDQQQAFSTPQGMEALLTDLFTRGAQNVPVLTQAFANATGSRSTGNSGLQLALGELNKGLAGQAASLVGQQQQAAANTAAQIANASKGTVTNNTGSTQRSGADPTTSLLLGAGGSALNWADKNKLLDPLKSGISNFFSGGMDFANGGVGALDANSLLGNYDSYDLQDVGSGLSNFAGNGDQMGNYGEVFSGFGDALSNIGTGIADGAGSTWDNVSDFFGFADGGQVNAARPQGRSPAESAPMDASERLFAAHKGLIDAHSAHLRDAGKVHKLFLDGQQAPGGYADGGQVKTETMAERRRAAMDAAEEAAVRGEDSAAAFKKRMEQQSGSSSPKKLADGGQVRNRNNMGDPVARERGQGSLNYAGYAPKETNASDALYSNLTERADSLAPTEATSWGTPEQNDRAIKAVGMSMLGMLAGPLGISMAMPAVSAVTKTPSLPSFFAKEAFNALGFNDRDTGSNAGMGGGIGGSGNSAGTGNGMGGTDGGMSDSPGAGDTAFAANGGHIQGPGTGTSDSIPARLSDGEFVLSKDVVDAVGVDFLQSLQDQFHTPAAIQKLQGRG